MIVLGIDPGTANTGFGVVGLRNGKTVAFDGGVIETAPQTPLEERLLRIHNQVAELIAQHSPDAVAIEDLYFGRNVGSALAVGHARGAVMVASAAAEVECHSYTPQQVKSAVCGQGRADKDQVQRMVQVLLGLSELPQPDHAADALAVAICHHNRSPLMAVAAR